VIVVTGVSRSGCDGAPARTFRDVDKAVIYSGLRQNTSPGTAVALRRRLQFPKLELNSMMKRLIIAGAMLLGGIETLSLLTLICRS
jgi:hypothetical protein